MPVTVVLIRPCGSSFQHKVPGKSEEDTQQFVTVSHFLQKQQIRPDGAGSHSMGPGSKIARTKDVFHHL